MNMILNRQDARVARKIGFSEMKIMAFLMYAVLVGICLNLGATPAFAHGGPQIFHGSEGGIVHAILTNPAEPATMYAATSEAGVFKSTDRGRHWRPVNRGLTRVNVLSLAADPASATTIYAGTSGGLFKSTDAGATWHMTGAELADEQIKALLPDPKDAKTIYAGTVHGLWRSRDAGATWSRLANQPENSNIATLALAPDDSRGLYAGTARGLFRSRDGGASWTRLARGMPVPSIVTLVIDPQRPALLYAGTANGAYRSDDGGDSWRSITFQQTNLPVTALLVDPRHPDTLYMGTSFVGGFFKTEDAGKTWTRIRGSTFTPAITGLAFVPGDPKSLIAATSFYAKMFISPDAGATWNETPGVLTVPALKNLSATPDGESLYAAAADGVLRFRTAEGEWTRLRDAGVGEPARVLYAKGAAPGLWVCGSKGIARGRLQNGAWVFQRQAAARHGCLDMALDAKTGRVFAAGKAELWIGPAPWQRHAVPVQKDAIHTLVLGRNGKTVYALLEHQAQISSDAGKTWGRLESDASADFIAVAETGTAPGTLWLATDSRLVRRGADGQWINAAEGMFPPGVGVLVESPRGDGLYATSLVLGRIFQRRAADADWIAADIQDGTANLSDLWIDPAHDGVIYAASRNSGLFRSADGGAHWEAVNAGLARK
jgi:photosystem II stability/assembly factor-like uncharacterized protein